LRAPLRRRGRGVGINFSYGGNLSQTTDSHRLIEKAYQVGGEEAQLKFVDRLFKTYFEEEGDIGDHNLLARDAETAGIMSKDEALAFLKGDELKKEVKQGIAKAQMRGISGVPFTILNSKSLFGVWRCVNRDANDFVRVAPADKLAISGAQETETFLDVFRKVASGEIQA
jgi:predicted DsbA family dithiol-disulfide isomerase